MFAIALSLHLIGACIWTGGHLVLALGVLPQVLRHKDVQALLWFEGKFEKLGIPALLLQLASGLYLAYQLLPDVNLWLDHSNPVARLIQLKLTLLIATGLLGLHARLKLIPQLSHQNLSQLAWHIIAVTTLSVCFVLAGISLRLGWLF